MLDKGVRLDLCMSGDRVLTLVPEMSSRRSPGPARALQRQALVWTLAATLVGVVLAAGLARAADGSLLAPVPVVLALGVLAAVLMHRALGQGAHPHAQLGPGNAITLARGAGIAALAGLVLVPAALGGWAVAALALAVAALDAADGWAARRSGTASGFGARLDVEMDVAFAAAAALVAWQAGAVGLWFLALPLLRPAFLLGGALWPALTAPLPPAPRRSRVAGAQYAGQVLLLLPVLEPAVSQSLGALILMMVAGSFAIDIAALIRGARR